MFSHRDIKITVDGRGNFLAEVRESKVEEKTLALAQEAIDKLLSSYAKSKVLNLKVVGLLTDTVSYYEHREKKPDQIYHAVLTGMNRTTGDLTFTGVPKDRAFRYVMPDTPSCIKKLEEWVEISKIYKTLQEHMDKFQIKGRSGRQDAAKYDEILEAVESQHFKATMEHQ